MAWLHWSLVLFVLFLWTSFLPVAIFHLKKWAPPQSKIPARICQFVLPRSLPNEETKSAFEMKKQDLQRANCGDFFQPLLKLYCAKVAFGGKCRVLSSVVALDLCITAPLKALVVWFIHAVAIQLFCSQNSFSWPWSNEFLALMGHCTELRLAQFLSIGWGARRFLLCEAWRWQRPCI